MPEGPTTEVGSANPGQGLSGITSWSTLMDDREYAPDLVWPNSTSVYTRMEATDAQVNGLLLGTMLPIRRLNYLIDPNGAPAATVTRAAEDTGLPILGRKSQPRRRRRRNRFDHDKHLAHALRSLVFGHFPFEQVGEIDDDGLWRLRKLATRPPRTLAEIQVERDGSLRGIKQNGAWNAPPIPVSRLVYYVWDSQDDGDWLGRSMLRAIFRNYLVKDRLIRVDTTKHERNGMGVPWFEADPAASDEQIRELAAIAKRWRAGEEAGGAGVGKLTLKGVDGSVPDTIASLKYHDQEMSKRFLQTFTELAGSNTGSRALGDSLIDFFVLGQDAIADWYCGVFTEHVLEDQVDWNDGTDVPSPVLTYRREESEDLAATDLASLVNAGALQVDDELEDSLRETYDLPTRSEPRRAPPPQLAPGANGDQPDDDEEDEEDEETEPEASTTASTKAPTNGRPRDHLRRQLGEQIAAEVRRAGPDGADWANVARAVGRDPKNGTARRAREQLIGSGAIRRGADGTLAPGTVTASAFRRELYEHEVEAGTDFETILGTWDQQRDRLVPAVPSAQDEQIEQLEAAVAAVDGDLSELAQVSCEPIDTEVIKAELLEAAEFGRRSAEEEARSQGVKAVRAAEADEDEIAEQVAERADALGLVLANALSEAARRRAVAQAGAQLTATQLAGLVRDFLESLSPAFLEEQLGGAIVQATNTGRKEFMRANEPVHVYASELLDTNTCSPCAQEDGTEWPTVEDAEADYPAGGYKECEGGLRCRGTLVAVYGPT